MDADDVHEAAWFGVVEHLYTASERPAAYELVRAGQRAVNDAAHDDRHTYGYFKYKTIGSSAGLGSMPAFAKFWTNPAPGGPENAVVERTALRQVLVTLTDRQREALEALAVCGDYRTAAAALDIADNTFQTLIGRARNAFLAWWHEGETPRRYGTYNRRRHDVERQPCGTIAAWRRHKAHDEYVDPECAAAAREQWAVDRLRKARAA
jgi:DNA-directed RNA polymerase specialized sigma24 family protein